MSTHEDTLRRLIGDIEKFPPVMPHGFMLKRIGQQGFYEEDGLRFVENDAQSGHVYVGLAVLARDYDQYLRTHREQASGPGAKLLHQVVDDVHSADSRYGQQAFPTYKGLPPEQVAALPTGLAEAAASGTPTVEGLGSYDIFHEWTFKPGKRALHQFLVRLGEPLQQLICGDLRKNLDKGPLQEKALSASMAVLLAGGFGTGALWLPLGAYLGLGIAKFGVTKYCEKIDTGSGLSFADD